MRRIFEPLRVLLFMGFASGVYLGEEDRGAMAQHEGIAVYITGR